MQNFDSIPCTLNVFNKPPDVLLDVYIIVLVENIHRALEIHNAVITKKIVYISAIYII